MGIWSRGRCVRGLVLAGGPLPPFFDFLPLLLGLDNGPGHTLLYRMAYINGGGMGDLLHLLHGLGAAVGTGGAGGIVGGGRGASEIVMGYLGGGAGPALFPLDKLFFQLGRHDALGLPWDCPASLLFPFAFDLIGLIPFFYSRYDDSLLKK